MFAIGMTSTSLYDAVYIKWYSGCVRTTVDLPEALLDNAKRRARERGVTLSILVQDALRHNLTSDDCYGADSEFRLFTVRGKSVPRDLDLDRTSSLIVLDDELTFGRGL